MADEHEQHDEHDPDHGHDHDHSHDHDHDHDSHDAGGISSMDHGVPAAEVDPAGESLADALRVSFNLLKLAMVVLVVLFVFSGLFEVEQNQVGMRVRFGKLVTTEALQPGWYFAWPAPVEQSVVIPTQALTLDVDKAFWFNERNSEITRELDQKTPQQKLTPGVDGSLITGDRNVVHAKFAVTYRIGSPKNPERFLDFVRNVSADPNPKQMLEAAERVMSAAAEHGIIRLAAQVDADSIIAGLNKNQRAVAIDHMQRYLDTVRSGMTVTEVRPVTTTAPLAVRPAYNSVNASGQDKATVIDKAKQEAAKVLSEAAGPGYPAMLVAIDVYEAARRAEDDKRIEAAAAVLAQLLEGTPSAEALEGIKGDPAVDAAALREASTEATVESDARQLVNDAKSYKTVREQEVQAEVNRFQRAVAAYNENPRIVMSMLWESVRQEILSSREVESFYLPDNPNKTLYLEINRDPEIDRRREADRYKQPEE